jgi:hypothetical protein
MFSLERAICFHGNTLAGKLIDHRQDAIRAPIRQLVADEIGRPALVWTCRWTMRKALWTADLLPLHTAHLQVLLIVKPVDPLGVHLPSLPAQQYGQPPVPIAHMRSRHFPESRSQRFLQGPATGVPQGTHRQPRHQSRTPLRDLIRLLRPPRQPTPLARL